MLKKIALTVMVINSSTVLAGTMGPVCQPKNLTVACVRNAWTMDVQALYLKPSYTSPLTFAPAVTGGLKDILPKWDWGYKLQASYLFGSGSDIQLSWLHYQVNSDLGLYSGQYLQLLPFGATTVDANYQNNLSNRFDEINLLMGQDVHFNQQHSARFYAGMQYAAIRVDRQQPYDIPAIFLPATAGVTGTRNSDFNGVGPAIGVDYRYGLESGINIVASGMTILLYGTARLDNSTAYGNGVVVDSTYGSRKQLVPGFEAKLGLNYAYPLAQGLFSIEGGYQVMNYFNALAVDDNTFSALPTRSDFALYGPYFGVRWLADS